METPRLPDKALLFVALLYTKEERYHRGRFCLEDKFGDIIMESPPIPWDFSDYYRDEMGDPLFKRLVFFRDLVEQGSLATIKLITKEVEMALSSGRRRTVNLDPGYLTSAKVVLASTKDYCHRIYLRDGIYGEITLVFKKGRFVPHVNTYMDYRDDRLLRVFLIARTVFSLLHKGVI